MFFNSICWRYNNLEDIISKTEDTLHIVKQYFPGNGLMFNPKKTVSLMVIDNFCHVFPQTYLLTMMTAKYTRVRM